MIPEEHGGHGELVIDGLEIFEENILTQAGNGLKVAQIRLGIDRGCRWSTAEPGIDGL